ncbi:MULTISPECIES: hypothetical protein [unclassified Bradyrhizobium]|uniref:hypothetical protein n=1 Tax=unclassified Bradyrhizobium TaxID=2631580 RepID=UPI00070F3B73|nr:MULTISPECIES: hypothetical protein [unclassified Bradyrhizobium]KQT14522.1 hypothetical protein ASG57_32965 [Bradyrhizobium sp. Leaf396]
MARRRGRLMLVAAMLLLGIPRPAAGDAQVNTIQDIFRHLRTCWRPPSPTRARPLDITVVVSFNRSGNILGHPRITYESAEASDNDRLQYRIAVMEALQRCTPVPFTDAMAGAAAGRPFAIQFRSRKTSPDKTSPQTQERRA